MSQKSIELRQQRNTLVQEMHDLTEKSSFPAEAKARWEELDKQQKDLEVRVTAIEASEKLVADMSKTDHVERTQPNADPAAPASREDRAATLTEKRGSKEYNAAFEQHLRTGRANTFTEELRTYSGLSEYTSGVDGEYLVPIGFQKELEIKLKAYGGMRNVCRTITTSTGNTLNWPTADDTTNSGEWLAEAGTIAQTNPAFGQVQFTSNVCDSKQVLVSVQLLQDSAFDVQSMLVDMFGIRIGRTINSGYTLGNGSGKPVGIVPSVEAYNSGSQVVTAVGANATYNPGSTDLNSVNLITDLDGLITAVDPAYRPGAKFMAHQATFDAFRKQKDGFGRPLWNVSVSVGEPDTIYGYGYQWNQDMELMGASNYSVLFGNFEHYVIRDVGPATFFVFQETYMASLQRGYISFLRTDGQLLQPAAFSVLQHPAS
jgi:HK97 family phage major capsid protein